MKAVISNDQDAQLLLAQMKNKESELLLRFRQQGRDQEYVAAEVMRGVHFVLVEWLQAQGFKVP